MDPKVGSFVDRTIDFKNFTNNDPDCFAVTDTLPVSLILQGVVS